jgi:uncharacterized OB-fold protein
MLKPERDYLEHLQQGRFMLLRSKGSGRCFFYPRVIEPGTGSTDLEWVEASGSGTVYAATVVRKKTLADSYNVVLVDLAEGPRMMSRVDGVPLDQVRIGMDVRARIVNEGEQAFVVFVPASGSAADAAGVAA